VQKALIEVY